MSQSFLQNEINFVVTIDEVYKGNGGTDNEKIPEAQPQKSIEGWVIFITNLHEEITEDELYDYFADCGPIKTFNLPLDRRTGYVKGYAFIEFAERKVAQTAIDTMNNACIMEKNINVCWCFVKPPELKAPKVEVIELNTECCGL